MQTDCHGPIRTPFTPGRIAGRFMAYLARSGHTLYGSHTGADDARDRGVRAVGQPVDTARSCGPSPARAERGLGFGWRSHVPDRPPAACRTDALARHALDPIW